MNYKTVKPFLKWAGGKNQLLKEIRNKYPYKIDRYCEPFVGGGAVLFDVLTNFQPKEVLFNDINNELINTYIQVRDNVNTLIEKLTEMQEHYWEMDTVARKEFYLQQREKYNKGITCQEISTMDMACLFIFLNKTCFNGLYRVNSKGLFNVPVGSYKKPPICDSENLLCISNLLQNTKITCGDYSNTDSFIDENTFVYIDPPYRPLTATSSFNAYSSAEFGDEQQIALSEFIHSITAKGAKILLSNSDPKNVSESDNFFDNLYERYNILRVPAKRMINSKGSARGSINELLICNY